MQNMGDNKQTNQRCTSWEVNGTYKQVPVPESDDKSMTVAWTINRIIYDDDKASIMSYMSRQSNTSN